MLYALSRSLIGLAVAAVLTGCSSPTDPMEEFEFSLDGHWQAGGLEEAHITVLKIDGKGLLVGTKQGLFRWAESGVERLGLEDHEIRGMVRLRGGGLLASVQASDFSSGEPTLFRSQDEGASWEPFVNNFGGDGEKKYTWIDSGPVATSPRSDTLFVRGNLSIARSTNGGQNWELVSGQWDSWGGFGALIKADPLHPGLVWAGGTNAFSQPYLWRSTDFGDHGEVLESVNEVEGVLIEGVVYDVITHPVNSDHVLVAMGGVQASTDGGESWKLVFSDAGIYAFARSRRHPGAVYATGRDATGKPFFAVTTDFGETWEKHAFKEGPSPVVTNDLAAAMIDGREGLFLGTDQGLFSFRFE